MKQAVMIVGSIYGGLSVILGALGAHALKKVLSEVQLASFEVGVKYMMYHAIVLLLVGFVFNFETKLQRTMAWSFAIGTFLFSCSIYFLSLSDVLGMNFRFLGPVTPLGGLFMIVGWVLLLISVMKKYAK
ncbi:DUF423 domain-containing protein [Carboxylicivirga sp. N1Y90]|uniref:DUF423 domain-containing protein n=1 Tax=Carboxylicivirga fragile TaxID=3417571 RepID=UPI003D357CFA|nr:DUF423 domain-containing protein [Marinilabiliaceae bacterium N1Y90]